MEVKPGPSTEDLSQIKRCNHAMIHWLSNDRTEALYRGSKKKDPCSSYQGCSQMEQTEVVWSFTSTGTDIMDKKDHKFECRWTTSQGRPKLMWKYVVSADLWKKPLNISLASDKSKLTNAIRPVTQQIALQPTMKGTRR